MARRSTGWNTSATISTTAGDAVPELLRLSPGNRARVTELLHPARAYDRDSIETGCPVVVSYSCAYTQEHSWN